MRTSRKIRIENPSQFKESLLSWAEGFQEVVWLDSNHSLHYSSGYDGILAVDAFTALKTESSGGFDSLKDYQENTKDWIFGYLSYDLKNDVEDLSSNNFDGLHFADLYFFQPKKLFLLKGSEVELLYLRLVDDEMEEDLKAIGDLELSSNKSIEERLSVSMIPRIPKEKYLEKVREMLKYIHRGDIYEANLCQEFYAEDVKIEPFSVFRHLNELSKPPFAAFVRFYDHYLLSASPERYIRKNGTTVSTQPIKGTAPRGRNPEEDIRLADELARDPKERSENIMIVDLVRNDLSKVAKKGTVRVEELCKVYSFPQVHQLISTVNAEIDKGIPAVEVIRSTFPMGSMTGAPKISAMIIIEELEETKRSLYSGAVGYFTPESDFDFNVVIRSILYNMASGYISFSVGGAITAKSNPDREYQECLVKAKALREVLDPSTISG